jgi:23S rRNA (guanosine2251-2'-O)-methyltransferase
MVIPMDKNETTELIIYGKQPVLEVLRSEHQINRVYIAREMDKKDSFKISNLAEKNKVRIIKTRKSELQKICGPVLHQGVSAVLDEYTYLSDDQLFIKISSSNNPLILILDQIQDPHNLGAIIRTAESAGVTAIILPEKGSASVSSTVAKTSAGAVFHCSICRTFDLGSMLLKLKEQNIELVALVTHRLETIYNADLSGPVAITVGSEGKGVRKNIQRLCDKSISIPGYGKVDSLNASVSTAVAVFEAVRQRIADDEL